MRAIPTEPNSGTPPNVVPYSRDSKRALNIHLIQGSIGFKYKPDDWLLGVKKGIVTAQFWVEIYTSSLL
jgi:hypothetical protein